MILVADWIKFLTFYDTMDAYLGGILLFVILLHLITSIAYVSSGVSLYLCHIYDIVVQVQHKNEYGVSSAIFYMFIKRCVLPIEIEITLYSMTLMVI